MEKITPGSEYDHLESQISTKNADYLRELVENSSHAFTTHIIRAAALYELSMQMYEDGGKVYSISSTAIEVIPLFDQPADDSVARTNLSIRQITKDSATLFKKLGINEANPDTTVMDNVINHYYQATIRSMNGQKIIVENSQGVKNELHFL